MSKSPPEHPLLTAAAGEEQTFHSESSQSMQAHPHIPSCAQHPQASAKVLLAQTICKSFQRLRPGSNDDTHISQGLYTLTGGTGPPRRCSTPSAHTTLCLDLTEMGQRRRTKICPALEEKPNPDLHGSSSSMRLWGYFMNPLNSLHNKGLMALGEGGSSTRKGKGSPV